MNIKLPHGEQKSIGQSLWGESGGQRTRNCWATWELNGLENNHPSHPEKPTLLFIWLDVCRPMSPNSNSPEGQKCLCNSIQFFDPSPSNWMMPVKHTHTHSLSPRISRLVRLCGLENLL